MENITPPTQCPDCSSDIKRIPGGISKRTQQPFDEFWACSNRDCKFTWNKPKQQSSPTTPTSQPQQPQSPQPQQPQPSPSSPPPSPSSETEKIIRGIGLIRGDIRRIENSIDSFKEIMRKIGYILIGVEESEHQESEHQTDEKLKSGIAEEEHIAPPY